MFFRQIVDEKLAQYAYLIGCQRTGEALVVDPERDVDRYVRLAAREGLHITAVAETHIHADFLSGAQALAEQGAHLYLSAEGEADGWGSVWARAGAYPATFLHDGDTFRIGHIEVRAIHTPGHTPEHLAFLVTDVGGGAAAPIGLVSGDFVFVGDLGRPDLLETAAGKTGAQRPAAEALYASTQAFMNLADDLQVWPGHGAGSACGKALGAVPQTTVGYEKRTNGALAAARRGPEAFVAEILEGQPEPPLYFARMKQLNRDGVPRLAGLPRPRPLAVEDLAALDPSTIVVDTRADRAAFMAAHLSGALYAPFNKQFNTVVGSFVTDPAAPLVLVIEDTDVEEAVRDLVRIGLDRVEGSVTPEVLAAYVAGGGTTVQIEQVGFDDLARHLGGPGVAVLDVRRAGEYAGGHVPGAVNIAHTRLAGQIEDVPEAETLYVHCQSGVRAAVASAFLARQGHHVRYVGEAFPRYREVGPVVEEKAAEPV